MDVPFATAAAWFAALVELIGGAALVVGLVTPLAGILLVVDMVGAYIFAHVGNGMFVDQDGAELVLALGAASLVFAGIGGGRLSLDHVIAPRLGVAKGSKARASAG